MLILVIILFVLIISAGIIFAMYTSSNSGASRFEKWFRRVFDNMN